MRAALPFLLLATGCGGDGRPQPDPSHDGLWRAETIDGDPVGRSEFLLRVRDGRVVGGKDACNHWGFDFTRPPEPDGTRAIISTLMACPGIPGIPAYWRAIGNGNAVPQLTEEGKLRFRAGGSEIVARRVPPAVKPRRSDRP